MNTDTSPSWVAEAADFSDTDSSAMPAPEAATSGRTKAQREAYKLEKRLCREVGRAITDFNMIEDGDKRHGVHVRRQGQLHPAGHFAQAAKARAGQVSSIVAVNLDQKQPGLSRACPARLLQKHWRALPHRKPGHLQRRQARGARGQDHLQPVLAPAPGAFCTRWPTALGCTKIALGHHRDDIVQTLMLNMFYGGRMKGMPPKLVSDDGKHVVIRPLCYVPKSDTTRWAEYQQFPIIPVQPVRQPGRPAARGRERNAARVGQEIPRPHRKHVPRHGPCGDHAHDGPASCTTLKTPRPPAWPTPRATSPLTTSPWPHAPQSSSAAVLPWKPASTITRPAGARKGSPCSNAHSPQPPWPVRCSWPVAPPARRPITSQVQSYASMQGVALPSTYRLEVLPSPGAASQLCPH